MILSLNLSTDSAIIKRFDIVNCSLNCLVVLLQTRSVGTMDGDDDADRILPSQRGPVPY